MIAAPTARAPMRAEPKLTRDEAIGRAARIFASVLARIAAEELAESRLAAEAVAA